MLYSFLICGSALFSDSQPTHFMATPNETNVYDNIVLNATQDELTDNLNKLRSFLLLRKGWNTYGSLSFNKEHIDRVEKVLTALRIQPMVFPTGRQSIQLEFEKKNGDYLELEIFADGKTEVYVVKNGNEKEYDVSDADIKEEVDKFYAP